MTTDINLQTHKHIAHALDTQSLNLTVLVHTECVTNRWGG